jgi:hypothetical protein
MIYSLPAHRPRELDWQLRCLQDCLPTHPVFRTIFMTRQSDCCWVAEAVGVVPAAVRAQPNAPPNDQTTSMDLILILCTGNSCQTVAEEDPRASRATSLPFQRRLKAAGYVHPLGIQVMKSASTSRRTLEARTTF